MSAEGLSMAAELVAGVLLRVVIVGVVVWAVGRFLLDVFDLLRDRGA